MRAGILGVLAGSVNLALATKFWTNSSVPVITPSTTWTTEVVTALTTFCPAPTTVTYNDQTYTITSATTLTVTNCPCTISRPVTTIPPPATTTKVITAITTYCPEPTTLTYPHTTITVTSPTTLTIPVKPTTLTIPIQPTTSTSAQPSSGCVDTCNDAYNKCRGQPGANRSTCAAQYASCLGYSPFAGNGTLITPTACSQAPVQTSSGFLSSAVTTTTTVVTAITTYCPVPTTLTYNSQTYTVTEPTTLTITNCPCTVVTTKPVVPTGPATSNGPFRPSSVGSSNPSGSTQQQQPAVSGSQTSAGGSNPSVSTQQQQQPAVSGSQTSAGSPANPTNTPTSGNSPAQTTAVPAGAGSVGPAKVLLAIGVVALL
ncbi:unnamed protein product [Clonostachys solani]|uniref:Uncharacterized protein n=1 Tax=Clonostachys solani TaxID=160281 RepID=A0A9N9ZMC9_9HYPO|nr:unnamed protein product [Clonostachys solani]